MNEICLICDSNRIKTFLRLEKRQILICNNCGLAYAYPRPTKKELGEFYASQYRKDHSEQESVSQTVIDYEQQRANDILPLIEEKVDSTLKSLDIGSSSGVLVKNIRDLNPNIKAYGLELNDKYRNASIQKKYLLEDFALDRPLEDLYNSIDKDFDLVTLVHVLEHLPKPKEILEKIHGILKEDGILYLEVPNIHTPYGDTLKGYFPIYHLWYFSENNVAMLLNSIGFEIDQVVNQGMGKYKISVGIVARKVGIVSTYRSDLRSVFRIKFWLRAYFVLRGIKLSLLKLINK